VPASTAELYPRLRKRLGALLALLFIAAAAAGSAAPAADGPPYEINAILSLTGGGAFLGKAQSTTLHIVEQYVNAGGGIAGRPIRFAIADDQSNPQVAVQLANELIAKDVPVVIGPTLVGPCNAVAALVKSGPVLYCLAASAHAQAGSYEFTAGVSTTDGIATDFRYLRERGLKKIAIITTTDASGQEADKDFETALAAPENKDVTVVAHEHYSIGDLSILAQLARIKASGAQAAIGWAIGAPFGTLLHGVSDAGLQIPIAASAANLIYSEMKQFAPILPPELYFSGSACTAFDSLPRGAVKEAVRKFSDSITAAGSRPDLATCIAWDPALIVVSAIKKFGPGATAENIRSYISDLHDYPGASGSYDFRNGNMRGLSGGKNSIIVRWSNTKDTWVAASGFGGKPL
jgi:branched-chain amino acid transport system substrate-binding protein